MTARIMRKDSRLHKDAGHSCYEPQRLMKENLDLSLCANWGQHECLPSSQQLPPSSGSKQQDRRKQFVARL